MKTNEKIYENDFSKDVSLYYVKFRKGGEGRVLRYIYGANEEIQNFLQVENVSMHNNKM